MKRFPYLFVAMTVFFGVNTLLIDQACADGGSGASVPSSVHAEGGALYVFGDFANPDRCAVSSVAVLHPANEKKMDRMMSMVMTAIVSGKKISMWFSGCGSAPWYPSAPRAVAMTFSK